MSGSSSPTPAACDSTRLRCRVFSSFIRNALLRQPTETGVHAVDRRPEASACSTSVRALRRRPRRRHQSTSALAGRSAISAIADNPRLPGTIVIFVHAWLRPNLRHVFALCSTCAARRRALAFEGRAYLVSARSWAVVAQLVRAPDCGSGGRWFEPTRLYHSNSLEPRVVDTAAKSAALRRNFYACAFSASAEETPIKENSGPFGASLYLQSRDLHFGLQVRVGSLCLPVERRSNFLLSRKLTAKNTGKIFDSRCPELREALENPCAAGTWEHFRAVRTA